MVYWEHRRRFLWYSNFTACEFLENGTLYTRLRQIGAQVRVRFLPQAPKGSVVGSSPTVKVYDGDVAQLVEQPTFWFHSSTG